MKGNDIKTRIADKNDQEFLFEMLFQSIYHAPDSPKPNREIIKLPEISKYVEKWGKQGDFAIIAIDSNGNKLGAAWLRYFSSINKGYGYINDIIPELGIAVDEYNRGRGIGSFLIRELLKKTKNENQSISLSVQTSNPAMKLYKRSGFYEWVREKDSVIMRFDNKP